jgi:hypothetical protein
MTATRFMAPAALFLLAGCATAPIPAPAPATVPMSPLVTSSGLVIGTLSYQYVEAGDAPAWTVHFERVDGSASEQYTLPVDVDEQTHTGFFTGALPAGVYAFREAASANQSFDVKAVKVPFEVQPGDIRDIGHYAVDPILNRQ